MAAWIRARFLHDFPDDLFFVHFKVVFFPQLLKNFHPFVFLFHRLGANFPDYLRQNLWFRRQFKTKKSFPRGTRKMAAAAAVQKHQDHFWSNKAECDDAEERYYRSLYGKVRLHLQ